MSNQPLMVVGLPASPYSRKMLALLRYRHIPYQVRWAMPGDVGDLPKPAVALLPTFYFADNQGQLQPMVDSSFILRRLEKEQAARPVVPLSPALAFIDYLLEDYCDEWLTKLMYHYRWNFSDAVAKAGSVLPAQALKTLDEQTHQQYQQLFTQRQVERRAVVGCTDNAAPVLEASYRRWLSAFENHLKHSPFLLGKRPGASDFACYGQLSQLTAFDPGSEVLAWQQAPRVHGWVALCEDLSGLQPATGDWLNTASAPDSLKELLCEVGHYYVPFLLANAAALAQQAEVVELDIDGHQWQQQPFAYQAKCLGWLQAEYRKLNEQDQQHVQHWLADTGCDALFAT